MNMEYKKLDFIGYPKYSISREGIVYSRFNKKTISPIHGINGYLNVVLYNDNGRKRFNIHRLVALAFIPNPDHKAWINHIDGNKHNNRVENLEWCSPSENNLHALQCKLRLADRPVGEETVRSICELLEAGVSPTDIVKDLNTVGVTRSFVQHIKCKETWTWVSKEYDIPDTKKCIDNALVVEICKCLENGMTAVEIGKRYNISHYVVTNIKLGRAHGRISCKYDFSGKSIDIKRLKLKLINSVKRNRCTILTGVCKRKCDKIPLYHELIFSAAMENHIGNIDAIKILPYVEYVRLVVGN